MLSSDFDHIFVIPKVDGDYVRLLTALFEARTRIDPSTTIPSFTTELQTFSEAGKNPIVANASRTAIIQLGSLGSVQSADNAKCVSALRAVEAVYGWKVFGVYGDSEGTSSPRSIGKALNAVDTADWIQSHYATIVVIDRPSTKVSVGPSGKATLLFSPSAWARQDGLLLATLWMEKSEQKVCNEYLRDLFGLGFARIISPAPRSASRCGSRYIQASPSDVLELSPSSGAWTQIVGTPKALWPVPLPQLQGEFETSSFDVVLVIPDIHGDLVALSRALWLGYNRVSETPLEWEAFAARLRTRTPFDPPKKRVALVQLGDIVDRGPYTKECIDRLLRIETSLGFKLIALYGNHELMNFYNEAAPYVSQRDLLRGDARDREFSLDGAIWRSLTDELVMMARFSSPASNSSTLFVHGGVDLAWFEQQSELIKSVSPAGENATIVDAINKFSTYAFSQAPDLAKVLFSGETAQPPVWDRTLESAREDSLCDKTLPAVLERFKVDRIIVGHNPQASGRVRVRCGGRVLLADTAMSKWMKIARNPTVLVMDHAGGTLTGIDELHYATDGTIATINLFPGSEWINI